MPQVFPSEVRYEGYVNPQIQDSPMPGYMEPRPALDLYGSYQNWINSLNPETAQSVRTDSGVYALPSEFDAQSNDVFSLPSGADVAAGRGAYSYIAPNIDDWGRTISPKIKDERDYQSEEGAQRARGQLEYQQLIAGGATPEEAYRRTAGLLHWNHPDKLAAGLARVPGPDTPFSPTFMDVRGGQVMRTSDRGAKFIRDMPEKMSQTDLDERASIDRRMRANYSALSKLKSADSFESDPAKIAELEKAIAADDARYRAIGAKMTAMPGAPTQPIAPPPSEGPAQPRTKAELDALPKGTPFLNPSDGKIYRKK